MPPAPRRTIAAAVALLLVLSACRLEQRGNEGQEGRLPEPPRPVGLGPDGQVDREKVIAAGRAGSYDVNPGASHRAEVGGITTATIEPAEGAYRNPTSAFDEGVVIGRLLNNGDKPLPTFGLVPGATTYWFIYRKDGKLLSAFIPDVKDAQFDALDLPTRLHPPTRPWRQSVAQWQLPGVLDDRDGADPKRGLGALGAMPVLAGGGVDPWITCNGTGCCQVQPPNWPPP